MPNFILLRPHKFRKKGSEVFALDLILIYISSVHVFVNKLLNGYTDFDEIFCMSSGGFHNGLD